MSTVFLKVDLPSSAIELNRSNLEWAAKVKLQLEAERTREWENASARLQPNCHHALTHANPASVSLAAVVDVRDYDATGLIEAEKDAPFADT